MINDQGPFTWVSQYNDITAHRVVERVLRRDSCGVVVVVPTSLTNVVPLHSQFIPAGRMEDHLSISKILNISLLADAAGLAQTSRSHVEVTRYNIKGPFLVHFVLLLLTGEAVMVMFRTRRVLR